MAGFEPATSSLPRKCSTPELHWRFALSGRRGSNSRPSAWKADALSTELLPQKSARPGGQALLFLWAKMDSNHRRYKPADLQSAPFDHSGIRPLFFFHSAPTELFRSLSRSVFVEPLVGFEPTTPRLQITCSGQLS